MYGNSSQPHFVSYLADKIRYLETLFTVHHVQDRYHWTYYINTNTEYLKQQAGENVSLHQNLALTGVTQVSVTELMQKQTRPTPL